VDSIERNTTDGGALGASKSVEPPHPRPERSGEETVPETGREGAP
jgi:hypothetical protein